MAKLISIVIPAYNEERVIPELGKRITSVLKNNSYAFEIIVVENGSKDKTLDELLKLRKKDKRFKIIVLPKNVGCDNGIMAGLTYSKGDAIVIMMADLQEPPELISKFIKKWEKGYDIVYAVVKKRENLTFVRRVEIYIFYKIMGYLSHGTIIENSSDFRLIDKKVKEVLIKMPEHGKFFRGVVMWTGFKKIGSQFGRAPRFAGKSKAYFSTVVTIAINALFGFSNAPHQFQWILLFISIIVAIASIFFHAFSQSSLFLILILINVTVLIQNQYLVRILEETRNRPQFMVSETYGI